jgi:hypothetical protein
LKNNELLDLFATKFGPEILDVSDSDFKYVQKIDWTLYVNPLQYFTSEREFLIGAILGKLNPELALEFPTMKDIFKIKESGSKLKTKAQKITFIQQCAEQLEKLPYNTTQLQRIKDFLQQKATQYKVPVQSVHASANFVRFTPPLCDCLECQKVANLSVSNSVLHPAEIFLLVEQAIIALHITDISEKIQRFHQVKCSQAKNILASSILDDSIQYCTNATEMQLNNTSLLVFQYNFDNQHVCLQFDSRQVHFILQDKLSLQPGQIKEINLNFVTNLQAVPELASELQECIAVAPDLQFSP